MAYCSYYQATIPERKNHLFVVGVLKYYPNLCFDRALDGKKGLFEFFVPENNEDKFEKIIASLIEGGIIKNLEKKTNPTANN